MSDSLFWLFVTPWTVAYQAPLSMGFSRKEYWSGLPFPSPGSPPNPGIKPRCPALQPDALPSEPPGKSSVCYCRYYNSECLCAYSCISHSDHCLWAKILDGKLLAYFTSLNYLHGPTPGSSPSNSSLSLWPLLEGASPDSGLLSHTRASPPQPWHYWDSRPYNCLSWGLFWPLQGVQKHPWPPPTRCQ